MAEQQRVFSDSDYYSGIHQKLDEKEGEIPFNFEDEGYTYTGRIEEVTADSGTNIVGIQATMIPSPNEHDANNPTFINTQIYFELNPKFGITIAEFALTEDGALSEESQIYRFFRDANNKTPFLQMQVTPDLNIDQFSFENTPVSVFTATNYYTAQYFIKMVAGTMSKIYENVVK